MIFETHAHYDDDAFDTDREELLSSLSAAGIGAVVNIGASLSTTANSLALSEKYPWMYAAVGVHPEFRGQGIGKDRDLPYPAPHGQQARCFARKLSCSAALS